MADYRLGVTEGDGETVWYELPSAETTSRVWRLLRDYGRDNITVTVQVVGTDGGWKTVHQLLVTRPTDWPDEQGDPSPDP